MLTQQSDLSLIAIGVETEYRSIARSLFRWCPKGESNALITVGSEVTEVTHDRSALEAIISVFEPEV
jgi:hypothetical protein